ncbi:MAG: hypothetical protein ACRYGA_15480 [Janthinobacterium lividum]
MGVASPVCWRKHGTPTHPSDLARHDALTRSRLGLRLSATYLKRRHNNAALRAPR